jgi:hypothetical protein
MVLSLLVVDDEADDEADVAELFRQRFRREARQGTYVLHFANLTRATRLPPRMGRPGTSACRRRRRALFPK